MFGNVVGLEVGDEVGVSMERFGEGKWFAGIFFHRVSSDADGRLFGGWAFIAEKCFNAGPMRETVFEFFGGGAAAERQYEETVNGFFIARCFSDDAVREG